ncbi:MAG: hypothetical protein WCU00_01175 [Candidatus Latescibacterota bacterium]
MKVFIKLLTFVATTLFVIATIIKFTQKVSYKEAIGIMEELCKEIKSKCPCCKSEENPAEESTPAKG